MEAQDGREQGSYDEIYFSTVRRKRLHLRGVTEAWTEAKLCLDWWTNKTSAQRSALSTQHSLRDLRIGLIWWAFELLGSNAVSKLDGTWGITEDLGSLLRSIPSFLARESHLAPQSSSASRPIRE